MTTFDRHTNFAYSTVQTAPSPATTGTSVTVQTGDGGLFGGPPFNATVCPVGTQPTAANAEVVRVTARPGGADTFTITRGQEGSSARAITVGDQFFAGVTAKVLTDIETAAATLPVAVPSNGATLAAGVMSFVAPGNAYALPAAAAAPGQLVWVLPSGVSGASPATINAHSGDGLYAPGVTGATSVALGENNGVVAFYAATASLWFVAAGQLDTGWVGLTLGTNIIATGPSQARRTGTRVNVVAQLGNTSGGTIAQNSVLATVPSGMAPGHLRYFTYWDSASMSTVVGRVNTSGQINNIGAPMSSTSNVFIDYTFDVAI